MKKRYSRDSYRPSAWARARWAWRYSREHAYAIQHDIYERWVEVVTWVALLRELGCEVHVTWRPEWDPCCYVVLQIMEPGTRYVRTLRILYVAPMLVWQSYTNCGSWKYSPATHTINRIK